MCYCVLLCATHCSVEKAIAAERKRWVGDLIEEAWRLFLLMRHRAVPYQGKRKSVVAIEGSRAQRRILARSGLARFTAPSVKETAEGKLQITWDKIHQKLVLLPMDNWYNRQITTSPDKNDKSFNTTAMAVLLLSNAPRYWHGHPSLEEVERPIPIVPRMLGNTRGTFARIFRDLGFVSTRPFMRNMTAPLDIIREVPSKSPHSRPLCLSKEKVSSNVSLPNLLQFTPPMIFAAVFFSKFKVMHFQKGDIKLYTVVLLFLCFLKFLTKLCCHWSWSRRSNVNNCRVREFQIPDRCAQ